MDKKRFSFGGLCVAALFAVLLVHCTAVAEEWNERVKNADKPKFIPGKVMRVDNPKIGGLGYFLIYLPKNYTPKYHWPVIFFYHGLNADPTTWPYLELTGGKGYIIIGMEYYKRDVYGPKDDDREVQNLKEVIPYLVKHLRINKGCMYISGFSKGGWMGGVLFSRTTDTWAGMIILGAGRVRRALISKDLSGKQIFIGLGEKDHNRSFGERAALYYRHHGAKVTLEIFKGMEHSVDTNNKALRNWLRANRQLVNVKSELASAGKLVKAGKVGRAYVMYSRLAGVSDDAKSCIAAAKAAKELAEKAEQQLAETEKAVDEKRYAQAARALAKTAAAYAGSDFGEQAEQKLQMLQADPQIKGIIKLAEINTKADALEAKAAAAEKEKKYAKAIKLYEQYVSAFPKAGRYEQVKSHLAAMKSDKAIQDAIFSKNADRDCRKWLMMANNYISAGFPEKAKPYLEKILDKYGQTGWAKKARRRLAEIAAGSE